MPSSIVWLIVLIIITGIMVLVFSIFSVLAASDVFKSFYYAPGNLRTAHVLLLLSAGLGFGTVLLIFLFIILAISSHVLKSPKLMSIVAKGTTPTKQEIVEMYDELKNVPHGRALPTLLMTLLIIMLIMTFVIGILSIISTAYIGGVGPKDNYLKTAYSYSMIVAIVATISIFFFVGMLVIYIFIRKTINSNIEKMEKFEQDAEKLAGINVKELESKRGIY